jgi:hypothetical protein
VIRPEFQVHMLNEQGRLAAVALAEEFSALLEAVERLVGGGSRELAIAKTKLEEACFFAKRALAQKPENQAR